MDDAASAHLSEPLDLVKLALGEYVLTSSLHDHLSKCNSWSYFCQDECSSNYGAIGQYLVYYTLVTQLLDGRLKSRFFSRKSHPEKRQERLTCAVSQAYDAHMNLVLSQVEESIHIVDVTDGGEALPTRVSLSFIPLVWWGCWVIWPLVLVESSRLTLTIYDC